MPSTLTHRLPYPDPATTPDVPFDMQKLAEGVDAALGEVLAGTIRNTGSGWGLLDDATHAPRGLGSTLTTTATYVEVPHVVGSFAEVGALVAVPDEALAALGVRCGTSVGLASTKVFFYLDRADEISGRAWYDGSSWQVDGDLTSASYSGNTLTISHEAMGTTGRQVLHANGRGTVAAIAGGVTDTTSTVKFYTGAWGSLTATSAPATTMDVWVTRRGKRANGAPPVNPASIVSATGNVWLFGVMKRS